MPFLASPSGGMLPTAPTIGTATVGNAIGIITFTASSYIGKGTITYTVTASPGGAYAVGTSPVTVSGLSNGTAYTFTVVGTTNYGVSSAPSASSNSVTPVAPTTTTTTTTAAPTTAAPTTAAPTAAPTTAAPCVPGCTPACGTATFAGATTCQGSICCGCESGCPGCWSGQRKWNIDNYTYSQQSCVDACGTTIYATCASFSVQSTVSSTCC